MNGADINLEIESLRDENQRLRAAVNSHAALLAAAKNAADCLKGGPGRKWKISSVLHNLEAAIGTAHRGRFDEFACAPISGAVASVPSDAFLIEPPDIKHLRTSHAALLAAAKIIVRDFRTQWRDPSFFPGFAALQAAIAAAEDTAQ